MKLDNVTDEDKNIIKDIMESHSYSELTETQTQAFEDDILSKGNHLLVADTGNGKTLCAEAVLKKRLDEGNSVAYLVPSRQLVRGKKDEINEWISDEYTVSTGSGKYTEGDVVIATFNSFYQAVIRGVGKSRDYDLAILDDFHELYGSFIGAGIEKSISVCKQYNTEIFAMSATIGNPDEISEWLDADLTISNESRSIPIEEDIVPQTMSTKKDTLADFVSNISSDKTPILVFNYAKSWTESRAEAISDKTDFEGYSGADDKIKQLMDGSITEKLEDLADLIENGVAYHHSSVPKPVREWIEDLYQDKTIKCLCATTTIAYGFDSPVQTVIVADMKRRGRWVGKWEYQQWIGRAARPGYGYEKGYAYIITNDEDTVRDEYFEPRELEPIKSHIDSSEEFRKLFLELVVMDWDTPEDIEEFIEESLYWHQLGTNGAWGRSRGNQSQQIRRQLRKTADWLEFREFIEEDVTTVSFSPTDKGINSIEFLFSAYRTHNLTQVDNFVKWLNNQTEIKRFNYLVNLIDVFNLEIRENNAPSDIESYILDRGETVNESSITASIIQNYWIQNIDISDIENLTGIDVTYLPTQAYQISRTIDASKHLINATSHRTPSWFSTYRYRINRGVQNDEVPYIRNVRGLGRKRISALREYLVANCSMNDDMSIWDMIESLDNNNSKEEVTNKLTNVSGISQNIAERLVEYHKGNSIPNTFKTVEDDIDTI